MLKTFKGGLHIPDSKNTRECKIENLPAVSKVCIPLLQHIGAPVIPLVKKGDYVKKGQLIGDFKDGLSCPVHASVSGTVMDITERISPSGSGKVKYIVIENDYNDTYDESIVPYNGNVLSLSAEDIISVIRKAGVCGQGGASFPTYAKIMSAIGKCDDIIINCAECEPYITENYRLMLEEPEKIIGGAKILMHACGAKRMTFAVEKNKTDAANILKEKVSNSSSIQVKILKTKYPQGDERQLISVIKGKQLPAGKLPADVGCVIFNAETCLTVHNALYEGMPLTDTVFTVDGDAVNSPKNVRAPIGTSISDVLEFCGGTKENLFKIIIGGPMMGQAQWDKEAVVMKNTSAILCFSEPEKDKSPGDCIHCGKCINVCPMHLMPNYLGAFSKKEDLESAKKYNILSCVECGCCTYICPAGVPVVQYIRTTKQAVISEMKNKRESEARSK